RLDVREQIREQAGAARVGARDVRAVAEVLRAGVDEQRGVAGDPRALVRDVVQDGGVRADRDDVLVRRELLVLLARLEEREVELELAARSGREALRRAAMAAHRAPGRLDQARDL